MAKSSTENSHFCPGCGEVQRHFPRYPWYFCNDCLKTACDRNGRQLSFSNASMSGGLVWYYSDDPSQLDERALGLICAIRNRPAYIHEARFGGIVAEPIPDNPTWQDKDRNRVPNLWSRGHFEAAKARLKSTDT